MDAKKNTIIIPETVNTDDSVNIAGVEINREQARQAFGLEIDDLIKISNYYSLGFSDETVASAINMSWPDYNNILNDDIKGHNILAIKNASNMDLGLEALASVRKAIQYDGKLALEVLKSAFPNAYGGKAKVNQNKQEDGETQEAISNLVNIVRKIKKDK